MAQPLSRARLVVAAICWGVLFAVGVVQVVRGFRSEGDHVIGIIGVFQAVAALALAIVTLSERRRRRQGRPGDSSSRLRRELENDLAHTSAAAPVFVVGS